MACQQSIYPVQLTNWLWGFITKFQSPHVRHALLRLLHYSRIGWRTRTEDLPRLALHVLPIYLQFKTYTLKWPLYFSKLWRVDLLYAFLMLFFYLKCDREISGMVTSFPNMQQENVYAHIYLLLQIIFLIQGWSCKMKWYRIALCRIINSNWD